VTPSYHSTIGVETMSHSLPPFAALKAFNAVGRLNGIRRAADSLGVSHAIVSRHLRMLEQNLGVALFDRSSGQLTTIGRSYHARIASAIAELDTATRATRSKRDEGLVVWCAPGLAHQWLTARLARYTIRQSPSLVDLRAVDALPDFANNEADGDIRYLSDVDAKAERGVRYVELARPNVVPVASPEIAREFSKQFRTASDLLSASLVHEGSDHQWLRWFACQNIDVTSLPRIAQYGHAHLALAAAKAGQGIALGNHYLFAEDIAEGRLVVLAPTNEPLRQAPLGAYVFRAQSNMWTDPLVARFRRWLVTQFKNDSAL
jgi:LysR family transcriptional regulator, glycine cleavage system transcriptional activator